MKIKKTGVVSQLTNDNLNIYSGTQFNAANMSLSYDYPTDVFKDYGYTTALKMTPTHAADGVQFMAYSYISNPNPEYELGQEYTVSMLVYVSPDCNAPFRLNLEHSNTWVANSIGSTSNMIVETKGSVFRVWGKCKASASDGKIYIMFYPNTNHADEFTQGYQLIAGLTLMLGNTPTIGTGGFVEGSKTEGKAYSNQLIFNHFIEI